jgi:hypothetical protein
MRRCRIIEVTKHKSDNGLHVLASQTNDCTELNVRRNPTFSHSSRVVSGVR